MGGEGGDKLMFCGSGTTAAIKRLQEIIGVAVPSTVRGQVLSNLREKERWVVFVGPHEHHSNLLSWRQSLAEVVQIGADERGLVDMAREQAHVGLVLGLPQRHRHRQRHSRHRQPPPRPRRFRLLRFRCERAVRRDRYESRRLRGIRYVATLLNDLFGVQACGGCGCAGPYGHYLLRGYSGLKPGWTRVSFPYYMSRDESEFILNCIEFIASYGHRFLPLYQFAWVTGDWTFKKRASKYHLRSEEDTAFASIRKGSKVAGSESYRFRTSLESA